MRNRDGRIDRIFSETGSKQPRANGLELKFLSNRIDITIKMVIVRERGKRDFR